MAIDGFLTRSVRDTAALIDATHGADVGAPYSAPPLHGSLLDAVATPPRRLRIAYSKLSFTGDPIHDDCGDAVAHTADLCAQLGHDVVEADPKIDILGFMRAWTNIVACGTELTVRTRQAQLGRGDVGGDLDGVTRGAVALEGRFPARSTSSRSRRCTQSAARWPTCSSASWVSTCC